jgi:general secretion pathway protein D
MDTIGGISAKVVRDALQAATNVKIISSPYLTVLDGRAARLSVGDQIPYLVQSTSANQSGETTTTNQIDIRDVGIILEVTPNIKSDNSVMLNVKQEVSSTKSAGTGDTLTPVISQRAIKSDVVVSSGKTVLLGGLIQDRSEKVTSAVPGVSKIPAFGDLFKQTNRVKERTELLVMITPRVVRSSLQLDGITRLLRARTTDPGL